MNNSSNGSAFQGKFAKQGQAVPLEAGDSGGDRGTSTDADEHSRNRRLLIITDDEVSAKLLSHTFELNAYEVLATSNLHAAVRFATVRDPGCILLMLSSLTAICDVARQVRSHTPTKIIAFSKIPVTAAERNVALQSGCDDYRDAFFSSTR
jgi:CheY-like chemotaxis protein